MTVQKSSRKTSTEPRFDTQLLKILGDAVMVVNIENRISVWNAAAEKMFGWKADEVIGRKQFDFIEFNDSDINMLSQIQDIVAAGQTWTGEYQASKKDGTRILVMLTASPALSDTGDLLGYICIMRPLLTLGTRSREQSPPSEFYDALLNSSIGNLYVYDFSEQRLLYVNNRVKETLGLTVKALKDAEEDDLISLIHPDDLAMVQASFMDNNSLSSNEFNEISYRMKTRDKGWRWFLTRFTPHEYFPSGSIKSVVGFAIDITEERESERQAAFSTRFLQVINQLSTGILRDQPLAQIAHEMVHSLEDIVPIASFDLLQYNEPFLELVPLVALRNGEIAGALHPEKAYNCAIFPQLQQGETLVIRDLRATQDQSEHLQEKLDMGIQLLIVIPLIRKTRLIGSIRFGFLTDSQIDVELQSSYEQIADQFALALDKKMLRDEIRAHTTDLEAEVQRRKEEAETLYQIALLGNQVDDFSVRAPQILSHLISTINGDISLLYLLDRAKNVLSLAAQHGLPHDVHPMFRTLPTTMPAVELIIRNPAPYYIIDESYLPDGEEIYARARKYTILGLPLKIKDRIEGFLIVARQNGRKTRPFTDREIAFVTIVAERIEGMVENRYWQEKANDALLLSERQRIARELHDSATQTLFSATLLTETAAQALEQDDIPVVKDCLPSINNLTQQALRELRLLVYELRPLDLENEGLTQAIQRRLTTVEDRSGIQTVFRQKGHALQTLPNKLEETIYRIIIEALNNALKHANPKNIVIELEHWNGTLDVVVRDDGGGFDAVQMVKNGGMGITNMRERAQLFRGSLDVLSTVGVGTEIHLTVPVGPVHTRRKE
jgi:PAS domain S-box-containing protein